MNSSNVRDLEQCLCPPGYLGALYTEGSFWSVWALKFGCVLMSWVILLTKEIKDFFSVSEYTQKQGKNAVLHHYCSCLETGSSCFSIPL